MLKFRTPLLITSIYKKVIRILFILLTSWVIDKRGFCECVETRPFSNLAINWRSKQNKTNLKHFLQHNGKQQTCAKFKQKLFNSMVVGAHQSLQFIRQNTFFLKNNGALSKFLYDIFNDLITGWFQKRHHWRYFNFFLHTCCQ